MKIVYKSTNELTSDDKKAIDIINKECFANVPNEDVLYDFVDEPVGYFFLSVEDKIIGKVGIHKQNSKYNEQSYIIGGFGGLAILPESRNNGYGSKLIEAALEKIHELNCDIACMCVDRNHDAYKLYLKYGFKFLGRDAYFIDALNRKKTDDSVMILGVHNSELANYILNSNYEFNYGSEKGYW